MRYPHIQQHDERDCGAACLSMVCEYYGHKLTIARCRDLIKVDNKGANIYGIVRGAKAIGLNADALKGSESELMQGIKSNEITFPFIARIINEFGFEHYIVVYKLNENRAIVGDPCRSKINRIPASAFFEQWQGQIIAFSLTDDFTKGNDRKDTFLPFFKYAIESKKTLAMVFLISILIMIVNLSGSLVFTYVMNDVTEMDETNISVQEHCHHDIDSSDDIVTNNRIMQVLEKIDEKLLVVFDNLDVVCASICILYIFRTFILLMRSYVLAFFTKKIDVKLTLDYYKHLVELPIEFYGTRKTGEFMSRFNDVANIRNAISATTLTLMIDTLMAIGCGGLLVYINGKLFLITFAVLIIYTVIVLLFKSPIKNINHNIMENEARVTSFLKESIDGIETIKAYQYEKTVVKKTNEMYLELANKNVIGSILYSLQENLIFSVESIGIVLLMWIGAYLCFDNVITIADLMAFYYLIGYFLEPVKNLVNLQPELQTAVVAAERLNDVLDVSLEDNTKENIEDVFGDILINDVKFRYGYREAVLNGIDMKIEKGKVTAIVGKSGCGKTTLAKLLMAFYSPESGSITINNKDLFMYNPKSIRNKIAYISQDVFLFSDTIKQNLILGNEDVTDEEMYRICKMCLADEFISNMPGGYDCVIQENGNNLSGGQKQRIAIARALLRKADVLILDEATSNLDSETEECIKNVIDKLSGKVTCIIIAHRLKTIKDSSYIYVMDNGMVAEQGTHDMLLEQKGIYYKNWFI